MSEVSGATVYLPNFDSIELVNVAFSLAILGAAALAVIQLFLAGIKLMTSGGNTDKSKEAVTAMSHTVMGIVVAILSIAMVGWVGRFFGFDLTGYLSFETLLRIINTWVGQARPDGTITLE